MECEPISLLGYWLHFSFSPQILRGFVDCEDLVCKSQYETGCLISRTNSSSSFDLDSIEAGFNSSLVKLDVSN